MKILHTADWHLGIQWHGVDRTPDLRDHIIPEIIDIALREQVELVLMAGDVFDGFDRKSLDLCAMLLRKPLKRLLEAGINVALIPGNHDNYPMFQLLSAALGITTFGEKARLVIFTKPDVERFGEVQVVGIPYLPFHTFRRLLAERSIDLQLETDLQNQQLSGLYENVLEYIKSEKLNNRQPAILIGHFSVSGAKLKPEDTGEQKSYSGYEVSYAQDLKIRQESLLANDQIPQYNALGHIHLAQAVPETVVPTYYAGAPDYFGRGEEKYKPQVLIIDLPTKGEAQVTSIFLKSTTPFMNETITNRIELQALADKLGKIYCSRTLGDLVIKVDDTADYFTLRDEAYILFPRLKEANTVVQVATTETIPLKFETTADYAKIADPKLIFDEYFAQNFSDEQLPHLQNALDNILKELSHDY